MRTILYKNPFPVKSIRIISVFSIIEILILLIVLTWDLSGDLSVVNAEKSCFPYKNMGALFHEFNIRRTAHAWFYI